MESLKHDYQNDEVVIGAFVSEVKPKDIREKAGISKSTYYQLKQNPEFMQIVRERRDAIVKDAVARMAGFLDEDIQILQEIIRNPANSPGSRITAIRVMFETYMSLHAETEIMDRLEALEDNNGTKQAF